MFFSNFFSTSSRATTSQPEHLRPLLSPAVHSYTSSPQTNMDSSRGQNGIQLLLAAEQEAQQIVNAARSAKQARLKQAKDEAERDIAQFRAQMEADYQRKVTETSGDSGANVKRLEGETDEKISNLKSQATSISQEVIHMLIRQVTYVKV